MREIPSLSALTTKHNELRIEYEDVVDAVKNKRDPIFSMKTVNGALVIPFGYDGVSVDRASDGDSYIDPIDGKLKFADPDDIRVEKDGLIMHGPYTNMILETNDTTNTSHWLAAVESFGIRTPNNTTVLSPSGDADATQYVEDGTSNSLFARTANITYLAGVTYNASVHLYVPSGQTNIDGYKLIIDLQDSEITYGLVNTEFDEWVRIDLVITPDVDRTWLDFNLYLDSSGSSIIMPSGFVFYYYGFQVTATKALLPYRKSETYGQIVSGQSVYIDNRNLPILSKEGLSIKLKINNFQILDTTNSQYVFSNYYSSNERITIIIGTSGNIYFNTISDGVSVTTGMTPNLMEGNDYEIEFSMDNNGIVTSYVNRVLSVVGTLQHILPTILYPETAIGAFRHDSTTAQYFGSIEEVSIYDYGRNSTEIALGL